MLCYITNNVLCYVMLCSITYVVLCYIHKIRYVI